MGTCQSPVYMHMYICFLCVSECFWKRYSSGILACVVGMWTFSVKRYSSGILAVVWRVWWECGHLVGTYRLGSYFALPRGVWNGSCFLGLVKLVYEDSQLDSRSVGIAWLGGNSPTGSCGTVEKWLESGALGELDSQQAWGPTASEGSWRTGEKRRLFFELACTILIFGGRHYFQGNSKY